MGEIAITGEEINPDIAQVNWTIHIINRACSPPGVSSSNNYFARVFILSNPRAELPTNLGVIEDLETRLNVIFRVSSVRVHNRKKGQ